MLLVLICRIWWTYPIAGMLWAPQLGVSTGLKPRSDIFGHFYGHSLLAIGGPTHRGHVVGTSAWRFKLLEVPF